MSRANDLLRALLDATPEPPTEATDPAELAAGSERMMAARQAPFDGLRATLEDDPHALGQDDETCALLDRLCERGKRWMAALTCARGATHDRLAAIRHSRRRVRAGTRARVRSGYGFIA
jgi:hypothetical protein